MSADVRLRRAVPDDVAAVVALVESAYRGEGSRAGWTTEADLLDGQRTDGEGIAAVLADPEASLLVAELGDGADGELVGCCEVRLNGWSGLGGREGPGAGAYFGTFAVRPGLQGAGIGSRLLAEAEAEAVRRWGSPALVMTTLRQRADLLAWYRRVGFVETGETRPFPYGDERYGRPRRPDLEFVVLRRPVARA
ncbi:GNAT family N-acetyltransferase [Kineococcus gynurae]|uniref:GNAT family N-acetyltransferase n=1 Tax=Kineococcus gynurae TaxID=452979 RepID=A0ABV5LMR0_9ACTN